MILKFDHISYSCTYFEEDKVLNSFSEYNVIFSQKQLFNIGGKSHFFKNAQNLHNITLLNAECRIPIEITAYSKCIGGDACLEVDRNENIIKLMTSDINETIKLFENLGFKIERNSYNGVFAMIKPFLDKYKISINILENQKKLAWNLDKAGYSSLAFIVDNIKKERERLKQLGYFTTNIERIKVNNRDLQVFFVKGNVGEIFEIIGV
jgi:hypothetical protein